MDTNTLSQVNLVPVAKKHATLRDYLALARLDHTTKQIFIVPGIVLAYILRGTRTNWLPLEILLGLVTSVCIASANYVINEYLDRDYDRYHPTKSQRRAVLCEVRGSAIFAEWGLFVCAGLTSALMANVTMFLIACTFALQGLVYNVPPLRTKDKPHLDVLSESINNPLRLMLGWAMVDPGTLPPSSILLSYWFGGAFLMAAKRYSEYREIVASHGRELLVRYRTSFAGYSEISLNTSCLVYGLLSTFFLAVFLIKYRIEYLLLIPAVVALFGRYLALGMKPNSTAQKPERLFRESAIMALLALLIALFILTTFIDLPFLSTLIEQRYIAIR
jgi:4-hydroxybenzoate polyprenyltransferase